MRRNRRGGHGGLEFGGSGEDSFVAVVVTKLTGALLFILLLTMVIMALLPKAVDLPGAKPAEPSMLAIATPEMLPDAIAGRPYHLALAASGGRGPLRWSIAGDIPEGLAFDPKSGRLDGTPTRGTPVAAEVTLRVSDGQDQAVRPARLVVYQSDATLTTPAWWKPAVPPVPWRDWLAQGFGFLLLWLVYLVGMNALAGLRRWSLESGGGEAPGDAAAVERRHALYRATVRLGGLSAAAVLAVWLVKFRA